MTDDQLTNAPNPVCAGIDYTELPMGLRAGTRRWIESGIQPGSFLSAVIANNLLETCVRADHLNQPIIFEIVRWFYNEAPGPCWGSVVRAKEWATTQGRTFEPEWLEEGTL